MAAPAATLPCTCAFMHVSKERLVCVLTWPAPMLCLHRLLVAFNTSSGIPVTHVPFRDAAGRAGTGMPDTQTNIAEAGTISMEFTSIGRLLGRFLS